MRKLLVGLAVLCLLLAPAVAWADVWTTAVVASIDVKAKTMVVKYKSHAKWEQYKAPWNEKTEWADDTKDPVKRIPATEALAKTLKPGSNVYVQIEADWDTGKSAYKLVVLRNPSSKIE